MLRVLVLGPDSGANASSSFSGAFTQVGMSLDPFIPEPSVSSTTAGRHDLRALYGFLEAPAAVLGSPVPSQRTVTRKTLLSGSFSVNEGKKGALSNSSSVFATQGAWSRVLQVLPSPAHAWPVLSIASLMAVGQSQWYHFGVGAPPILVYFSGDWDVYWGYGILTHSLMILGRGRCGAWWAFVSQVARTAHGGAVPPV